MTFGLYFAFHYHAALFGGLIILNIVELLFDAAWIWCFWAFCYHVLALKYIWKDSTKRAIQRSFLVLFIYGFCFIITFACVGVYSVYQLGLQS